VQGGATRSGGENSALNAADDERRSSEADDIALPETGPSIKPCSEFGRLSG
jgi:hypothetical protein